MNFAKGVAVAKVMSRMDFMRPLTLFQERESSRNLTEARYQAANVSFGWKADLASAEPSCQPAPMKVDAQNYDRMRAWLACVAPQVFPADLMTPATDPITVLDRMAAVSPANARRGLSMAVNDIVELTSAWPAAQIAAIDNGLLAAELPSLSEVRARFSKALQRVLRRGRIKDEVEYYAVRNAAELSGEDQERFWPLLAMYEEAATG